MNGNIRFELVSVIEKISERVFQEKEREKIFLFNGKVLLLEGFAKLQKDLVFPNL